VFYRFIQIFIWCLHMLHATLCQASLCRLLIPVKHFIVQSPHVKLINTCDDHRVDHRILETRPTCRSDLTQLVILPLSGMYFYVRPVKINESLRIVPWCVGDLKEVHPYCLCMCFLSTNTHNPHATPSIENMCNVIKWTIYISTT